MSDSGTSSDDYTHDARLEIKYNVQSHLQGASKQANRRHAERSALGYAVLVYNLKGDKNTGMIIRTSVIMGASKVFIIGVRKYDERTVVGAKHYIDVEKIRGIPEPRELLKNYSPIIIEQGGISLDNVNWSPYSGDALAAHKPPCFIMGSEDEGVPVEFQAACSKMPGFMRLSIFQHGILRSMNVATAHSIVLYEYTKAIRQRVAGVHNLL
jgi:tRNA G18 (ribose-2'-O)-methylase SpoU